MPDRRISFSRKNLVRLSSRCIRQHSSFCPRFRITGHGFAQSPETVSPGNDLANVCLHASVVFRAGLAKLLKKAPENIKFSEELTGTKEELLRGAKQSELEDLIAKRPDSLHKPGRRNGAWVKSN
jgi:hypothetical protein